MAAKAKTLEEFIGRSLAGPAQPAAKKLAQALSKDFNGVAEAVLYYGSCLRTGEIEGLILDFYVLVPDYTSAHRNIFSRLGNALVPPNVYYREIKAGKKTVRAKVAVLSLKDFQKRTSGKGLNVSVWARFAQPSRLLFVKSEKVKKLIIKAVAEAAKTMAREALPIAGKSPKALWVEGLGRTYNAELRSEGPEKAVELFKLNEDYYKAVTPLLLAALEGETLKSESQARRRWLMRTINGKVVSIFRLMKAMFTFKGGIDYLAWKIRRSSGVEVEIKPWHRKVPFIAGIVLFIQLRLRGAFR